MSANYARAARNEMDAALTGGPIESPAPPVSCAALLTEKLGAFDQHQVLMAGFAGGIGLSGGVCGALGAAIWLIEVSKQREGGKYVMNRPEADAAIKRFVESTGVEFECAKRLSKNSFPLWPVSDRASSVTCFLTCPKIVGRKFADVADHAAYLHEGGCSKVIGALASGMS